jgi:hypothetical protein
MTQKIKFRSADAVINPHEEALSANRHSKDRLDSRVAPIEALSEADLARLEQSRFLRKPRSSITSSAGGDRAPSTTFQGPPDRPLRPGRVQASCPLWRPFGCSGGPKCPCSTLFLPFLSIKYRISCPDALTRPSRQRPSCRASPRGRPETPHRSWGFLAANPINRERRRVWRVCRPRSRAMGQSVANGPDRCDKCVF